MTHALLFHLLSLTVIATGMLGSFTIYLTFRKALHSAPGHLPGLGRMFPLFAMVAQGGLVLMILSGLALMYSRGWADWGQPWLMAKFSVIVVLALNGPMVARPAAMRMAQALAKGGVSPTENPVVRASVRTLALFYTVQVTGLAVIIGLAVLGPR